LVSYISQEPDNHHETHLNLIKIFQEPMEVNNPNCQLETLGWSSNEFHSLIADYFCINIYFFVRFCKGLHVIQSPSKQVSLTVMSDY